MNKALNAKLEIAKNGGEKIINRSTISIKQLDLDFLEEQFKTHEIKEATYGKYLKDLKKMSQNKFYTKPIVNVKKTRDCGLSSIFNILFRYNNKKNRRI